MILLFLLSIITSEASHNAGKHYHSSSVTVCDTIKLTYDRDMKFKESTWPDWKAWIKDKDRSPDYCNYGNCGSAMGLWGIRGIFCPPVDLGYYVYRVYLDTTGFNTYLQETTRLTIYFLIDTNDDMIATDSGWFPYKTVDTTMFVKDAKIIGTQIVGETEAITEQKEGWVKIEDVLKK